MKKLHAVLEAIPDLVFSVSREGRVSYSKSSMSSRDLLLPPEQGENRLLSELMPTPLSERLTRAVQRALDERTVQTERYALPLPGGQQEFEARFARQDADTAMVIVRNVTSEVAAARALADHLERLRVVAAEPGEAADPELTPRERDVLRLVSAGLNTKEVADELGISDKTVHALRSRLLKKLNMQSVAELTKYAIRRGFAALD